MSRSSAQMESVRKAAEVSARNRRERVAEAEARAARRLVQAAPGHDTSCPCDGCRLVRDVRKLGADVAVAAAYDLWRGRGYMDTTGSRRWHALRDLQDRLDAELRSLERRLGYGPETTDPRPADVRAAFVRFAKRKLQRWDTRAAVRNALRLAAVDLELRGPAPTPEPDDVLVELGLDSDLEPEPRR